MFRCSKTGYDGNDYSELSVTVSFQILLLLLLLLVSRFLPSSSFTDEDEDEEREEKRALLVRIISYDYFKNTRRTATYEGKRTIGFQNFRHAC